MESSSSPGRGNWVVRKYSMRSLMWLVNSKLDHVEKSSKMLDELANRANPYQEWIEFPLSLGGLEGVGNNECIPARGVSLGRGAGNSHSHGAGNNTRGTIRDIVFDKGMFTVEERAFVDEIKKFIKE
ncbi:unnamed protein product [Lupinus luteus]|uniref:Uncharacterized protein n=1 Tax=Lupinus luteus TaxID=3873 RepID=A0AAV1WBY6_LUPLU